MDSKICICTLQQQYNCDLMRPFFIKALFARMARKYTEIIQDRGVETLIEIEAIRSKMSI